MPHRFSLLLMIAFALLQTGCVWPFSHLYQRSATDAPILFTERPSQDQIIQTVNSNSQRVHALESQVKVTVDGLPGITGNLALEKPQNFRLQANLLGVSGLGADVGSNDELFWVWVKTTMPGQTPQILYARHAEYAVSPARQMLPIDPTWIRDALGLTEFDPQHEHEGPADRSDGQLEIRTRLQTPTGPQTRITAIDPKYGWITEQMLLDPQGTPIVIARSSRHRFYPEVGVSLPQRITINVAPATAQSQTLTVDAQNYTINRLSGDPSMLWTMPQPPGVPMVDLAAPIPGMYPSQPASALHQDIPSSTGYSRRQPDPALNSYPSRPQPEPYQTAGAPSQYSATREPRNSPLDRQIPGAAMGRPPRNDTARGGPITGNSTPNYRGRLLR